MHPPSARWYLTPVGRRVRASLGLPFLTVSVYLLLCHDGVLATVLAVASLTIAVSLPWAAVVQEPD